MHIQDLHLFVNKHKQLSLSDCGCVVMVHSGGRWASYQHERIPTLTKTRAGAGGFYLSSLRRMLSTEEMLRLQGLPVEMKKGKSTSRQFAAMIGNAMTVPVLAGILRMLLVATKMVQEQEVLDPCCSSAAST